MTGPLNALGISLGSLYLFSCGGFSSVFPSLPEESKSALKTVLSDSTKYLGLGAAMDCQQGLSPLYARRTSRHDSTSSLDQNAMEAYGNIDVPVSLWYGTKDGSVPMKSAEWLHQQIPHSTLHKVEAGHDLYFYHVGEILDEILAKADQADHINRWCGWVTVGLLCSLTVKSSFSCSFKKSVREHCFSFSPLMTLVTSSHWPFFSGLSSVLLWVDQKNHSIQKRTSTFIILVPPTPIRSLKYPLLKWADVA